MNLQFTIQPIDSLTTRHGILCCVCGEYRYEKKAAIHLQSDCGELGYVCIECVSLGPEKAGFIAYQEACNLRQHSDRQFYIASEVSQVPEKNWPSYKDLLNAKKGNK